MSRSKIDEIPSPLRDRARGVLLGQLVGDALGTTTEFSDPTTITRRFPGGHREIVGGGPFNVLPGQVTDDSELALALARTLVQHGLDLDARARAYAAWHDSGPFDIGQATRAAFGGLGPQATADALRLRATQQNGAPGKQANGALMRVSPLGVFGAFLPPALLAEHARHDAQLSHPSPVCQAANTAFLEAIRALLHGAGRQDAWTSARDALAGLEGAAEVLAALDDTKAQPTCHGRGQGWVLLALRNAFHLLLHEQDFEQALIRTVMAGGDADTNGCIAGALLGAACGVDGIPARWVVKVLACRTPRGPTYQATDALTLADQLLERGFTEAHATPSAHVATQPAQLPTDKTARAVAVALAVGGKTSAHRREPDRRLVIKVPLGAHTARDEVRAFLDVEPVKGQAYWVFEVEKHEAPAKTPVQAPRVRTAKPGSKAPGIKTSESHPIHVDWLLGQDTPGKVGITIAPGKHATSKYTAGRWERDLAKDLDALVNDWRTDVLVCLLQDSDLAKLKIPDLVERAQERGLEVIRLPIKDVSVLADDKPVLDLVQAVRERAGAGKNVVIHCEGGLGRAGTVAGCYLALLGHDAQSVLDLLVRSRSRNCPETEEQRQFIRTFASRHARARAASAR